MTSNRPATADSKSVKLVPSVRLSSREVEDLIRKQYEHAKLTRLHQVREQAAQFSRKVRESVHENKRRQLRSLENQIKENVQRELKSIVTDLETEALTCLSGFGEAHAKASRENGAEERRKREIHHIRQVARQRGKEALRELKAQKNEESREKNQKLESRKQALETEAIRSAYIVSLPPVHVVDKTKPPEEQPKVMLFDKRSLFQTEYTMKEKVVEPVDNPLDAREAALREMLEDDLRSRQLKQRHMENQFKSQRRGEEAMNRQKTHTNYLRLLEELDKIQGQKDDRWEVESTLTSAAESSVSSPRSPSARSQEMSQVPERDGHSEEIPVRDTSPQHVPVRSVPPEDVPVRDVPLPAVAAGPPVPKLSSQDAENLREIGKLLRELKEEQNRFVEADRNLMESCTSGRVSLMQAYRDRAVRSQSSSSGSVVYDDESVEIRVQVADRPRPDEESGQFSVRSERRQLPEATRRIPLTTSATSTPLRPENPQKKLLKDYVQKLLRMKRQEIQQLSVGSSFSSFTTAESSGSRLSLPRPAEGTETSGSWTESTLPSSYDSPATSGIHSVTKSSVSCSSTLPLGVEASVYAANQRPASDGSLTSDVFSLRPILQVYNDIYQAYNQRKLGRQPLPAGKPDASATENSFVALTLSSGSSQSDASTPVGRSFGSNLELTLSSSGSSLPSSAPLQSILKKSKESMDRQSSSVMRSIPEEDSGADRSTLASSSSACTSTTLSSSSDDISMPDVDEALRRLGLPSMQMVLRR